MRCLIGACVVAAATVAAGCSIPAIEGSGHVGSESRDVSGFHSVSLSLSGELHISQTGEESLTITADDNLLEYIRAEVRDGKLEIGLARECPARSLRPTLTIRYELTVKDMDAVAVSGSANALAEELRSDAMAVAVSGSGNVVIRVLETERVDVAISGSGSVSLGGTAPVQSIAISGSGEYDGGDLRTQRAAVAVSGSGDATIWAEEKLDVGLSGSGSVEYYGAPEVERRVSGSGSLRSLGSKGLSA